MEYTTETAIENYLKRNIDASFSTQVTTYIEAMSAYIDETVGYPVYRDTATTRKYDGNNTANLLIDPVHTITEVRVDGTVVTPTQYPYNNDVKYQLLMTGQAFSRGTGNVEVDGIFARSKELPKTIEHACTVFCALILNQVDEQTEGVGQEKIGDFTVTYKNPKERADLEMARSMVQAYKPITF